MIENYLDNADSRSLIAGAVLIALLLCAVEVMYLLWPQWQRYHQAESDYKVLSRVDASGSGLTEQLTATRGEVDTLSRRLHGDTADLPAQQLESYIIGRLQRVSWKTGVELVSVKPGAGQQVQMFQEGLFDVRIQSTYHKFIAWLRRIDDELGFIVVKKYRIAPLEDVPTDAQLNIQLTMVAYRMKNK